MLLPPSALGDLCLPRMGVQEEDNSSHCCWHSLKAPSSLTSRVGFDGSHFFTEEESEFRQRKCWA